MGRNAVYWKKIAGMRKIVVFRRQGEDTSMRVVANDFTAPEIMKFIRQWTEMTQVEFADTIDRRVGVVRSYEQGTRHYTFERFSKSPKSMTCASSSKRNT